MGTSAGGNAINEALMSGYTNKQATLYGIMVGSLEGGLQYLLSSIPSVGSGLSSRLGASAIKNINNAFARASAELGAGMVAEGVEEYMQDIINPLLRNIALGERNEFKLVTEEALYSALLGALSAGVLEGPGIVGSTRTYEALYAGRANHNRQGKSFKYY